MGVLSWLKERLGMADSAPSRRAAPVGADGRSSAAGGAPLRLRRERGVPDSIRTYYIAEAVLEATQRYLEEHGAREEEGYVFWAGGFTDDAAYVTTCVYPRVSSRFGGVRVPLEKMTSINLELRGRDQLLVAQVHSHPGIARHSEVDEQKAATFHDGFVSIVVPDFGATPVHALQSCGVYVYRRDEGWVLLSTEEVHERFVVERTRLEV